MGVVVLHPQQRQPAQAAVSGDCFLAPTGSRRSRGAGRAPRPPARLRTVAGSRRSPARRRPRASAVSRSPMCWLRKTCSPHAEGDGVLQVRAHRQERRQPVGRAAPAAGRSRGPGAAGRDPPGHDRGHRIVHVARDGPVVDQEHVGDAAQARQRLGLVDADRLVAQVAAGGDHRESPGAAAAGGAAACRAASRPGTGCRAPPPSATPAPGRRGSSTMGASGATQQRGRLRRRPRRASRAASRSAHHQREGLLVAGLALPQAGHRRLAAGVARSGGSRPGP